MTDGDRHGESDVSVIDVHAHILPLPLLEWLSRRDLADLAGISSGVVSIEPMISGLPERAAVPLPVQQYDLSARLDSMAAVGVTSQAVSAPPFVFGSECRNDQLVMDVVRRTNDAIAEHVAASGGALLGMGTVPVGLPQATEELARCQDELGFVGVTAGTFGGGRELDDRINEELWGELARRQCFVLLHPSTASAPARLADYHLMQLLGYPAETALATARLVFGGVLDRHRLVLCLAHGGGCLRGVAPRLDLGWKRKSVARMSAAPPTRYLRDLYYDTAVFDHVTLRRLVADVGADRVLLGTDFPFDLADRHPVETVDALGLSENDRRAVLGGNANRLLRLPAAVRAPDSATLESAPAVRDPLDRSFDERL
ncbi:amidohydrolase family protein [Nocardia abscessus]|uniref:amidohydrolase family protein n=1 Tax=Nocardia abscessus TaxID=120957 RepID=UPI0007C5BA46|nr:amidohydrolase family protein [Nocardia abscessus]MCC3332199.1 amidohydrolase [Nocardia abscessus]